MCKGKPKTALAIQTSSDIEYSKSANAVPSQSIDEYRPSGYSKFLAVLYYMASSILVQSSNKVFVVSKYLSGEGNARR